MIIKLPSLLDRRLALACESEDCGTYVFSQDRDGKLVAILVAEPEFCPTWDVFSGTEVDRKAA